MKRSTHNVRRGPFCGYREYEEIPCYCAATMDHSIGREVSDEVPPLLPPAWSMHREDLENYDLWVEHLAKWIEQPALSIPLTQDVRSEIANTFRHLMTEIEALSNWRAGMCERLGVSTAGGAQWSTLEVFECVRREEVKAMAWALDNPEQAREVIGAAK